MSTRPRSVPGPRRRAVAAPVTAALLSAALLAGCDTGTEPTGPTADVRGTWAYQGTQATPNLVLVGTLVIAAQTGANVSGSLTWDEQDGFGGSVLKSAPISGRVIGLFDADVDVLASDATRRHVGRISANADTIVGVWIAASNSRNGSFTAVRSVAR